MKPSLRENQESREFLSLAGPVGVLAVHGGRIEPGTEAIARFVARHSGASLYVYSGLRSEGNLALHRPSHRTDFSSRKLLLRLIKHIRVAISIHGHGRGQDRVYVGGLNEELGRQFLELAPPALPGYKWISEPARIPPGMRGRNPNNIVNLPSLHGIQLELPRSLRRTQEGTAGRHLEPVADALILSRVLVRLVDVVINSSGPSASRCPEASEHAGSPSSSVPLNNGACPGRIKR